MKSSTTALVTVVLGCSLSLSAYAQQARWGEPGEATVQLIKASEKMWLDSDCGPQPGLEEVFADDFQGTSPNGERYGKKEAMASPDSPATDCRLGDITVHFFGDAIALVYGSESSLRTNAKGEVEKRCLVWTDTWLERSGRWQIVAAQDNEVPCK
jgi:Domain of unknown function (DUF4440)